MWKYLSIATIICLLIACQSDNKSSDQDTENSDLNTEMTDPNITSPIDMNPTDQTPQDQPTQVSIPAGADGIVHHYICNDLCVGGHSENPGNCPVCNKALAHNQAWHDAQNQNQPTQNQQPTANGQQAQQFGPRIENAPPAGAPTQNPLLNQQSTETPQQVNIPAGADGVVHHYVCTAGCKGGHSESAGSCPVCKKALAHNQAWHNQ